MNRNSGFGLYQLLLDKAGSREGRTALQDVNAFRARLKREEIRKRNEARKAKREGHFRRAHRLTRERKEGGGFTKQDKAEP